MAEPMRRGLVARRHLMAAAGAACALIFKPRTSARAEAAQPKMSQAEAFYQDTPNSGQQCSECTKFQPPKGCSAVVGEVSPRGWCKLYEEPPE